MSRCGERFDSLEKREFEEVHDMRTLAIDIETYRSKDLTKCGVYAYANQEDFEILLFGYAFDDEEVKMVDFAKGEVLPREVFEALTDESVIKTAFNAAFERTCLAAYFKRPMKPKQWRCTAVKALELWLPGSLEGVTKAMNLEEGKLKEGKELIKFFSMSCKATGFNKGISRNFPSDAEERWALFKAYCIRDVEVERTIRNKLDLFRLSKFEDKLWFLDQEINDRGIRADQQLIDKVLKCINTYDEAYLWRLQF